jgi:hypothetical protein
MGRIPTKVCAKIGTAKVNVFKMKLYLAE